MTQDSESSNTVTGPTLPVFSPGFEQLRRLTAISRALTYTTSLEQVTRLTVQRAVELLDGTSSVLMLPDAAGVMHVRDSHGVSEERVERFRAHTDELTARLHGLLGVDDDAFVAVPLVVGGEVTGLLAVATKEPSTPGDEWMLSALADQTAVALENARLGGARLEMQDQLRTSEDVTHAKDNALSTLAHDIRTPLGAIDGYSELMEDEIYGPINDRQREALGRIRMSGRHLLSLLDNVMYMARINAGAVRVSADPVKLLDVAREAVHMLLPAADAKMQTLLLKKRAAVTVTADHARVRQVLVNLINNAVKFTPPDGSINVTTSRREIDGRAWGEVRISDTGPGIAPEEHAAIFEPYYRSAGTATNPGVGLGLAICHALVKQMGGEFQVESELGAGSSFSVRLPEHTSAAG